MRKPDLAAAIANKADLSKDKAQEVINILLDSIADAVRRDDTVSLVGFGSFLRRERAARIGKNPQTGKPIEIAASKTIVFKPGKALKSAVNG